MTLRDLPLLGGSYKYPVWNRVLELVGILAFVGFSLSLTASLVKGFLAHDTDALWLIAAASLVGLIAYTAADFVSGLVHCLADNFGEETTPLFGVAFIRPFRDHHRDPKAITHHDFVETNGNSCIVNTTVLVPTALILPVLSDSLLMLCGGLFIQLFTLAILGTNQFHKWAHMDAPPAFARALARMNLVLPTDVHDVHHKPPFDRYYCITTGWLNPMLDRLGFFGAIIGLKGDRIEQETEIPEHKIAS